MFCVNCGAKLPDGIKFCSECGENLSVYRSGGSNSGNSKENVNANQNKGYNVLEKNDCDVGERPIEDVKKEVITKIFREIFNDSRVYGKQVYIIGKNPINQEIKENLEEYYLEDRDEKPLLVFDYKNGLENGFVITNHRLVWYYGSKGRQALELEDIKDSNVGKAILATVMRPIDFDNVQYPEIYLDGIMEKERFVVKFNKFIDEIYYTFYGEDEDEEQEEGEGSEENTIAKLIIYACHIVDIDSIYCVIGNPVIDESSKKYALARKNFNIPDEDDIYLIYDTTVFGGCERGFALCTSGFYYCESGIGYLDWYQFSRQNVTGGFTSLKIAGQSFPCSDIKKLLIIMNTIIENLR